MPDCLTRRFIADRNSLPLSGIMRAAKRVAVFEIYKNKCLAVAFKQSQTRGLFLYMDVQTRSGESGNSFPANVEPQGRSPVGE